MFVFYFPPKKNNLCVQVFTYPQTMTIIMPVVVQLIVLAHHHPLHVYLVVKFLNLILQIAVMKIFYQVSLIAVVVVIITLVLVTQVTILLK